MKCRERRRLEKELLEASEREQRRIGYDLHDSLCQHLTATALAGQVLGQKWRTNRFPRQWRQIISWGWSRMRLNLPGRWRAVCIRSKCRLKDSWTASKNWLPAPVSDSKYPVNLNARKPIIAGYDGQHSLISHRARDDHQCHPAWQSQTHRHSSGYHDRQGGHAGPSLTMASACRKTCRTIRGWGCASWLIAPA